MKTGIQFLLGGIAACIMAGICFSFTNHRTIFEWPKVGSLSLPLQHAPGTDTGLLAYKNSPHRIFVGYLVGDGADPKEAFNPANAPDSVDFLEFFAGNDPDKAHWRIAQAKGTRLIACHFLGDAWFDNSVKDPDKSGAGLSGSSASSTYDHWARYIFQKHILQDSLDGIDLDIEVGTFGGDVQVNNLKNLLISVAKYFGPASRYGLTAKGKRPVFFYDTDGSVQDSAIYNSTKQHYDYALFQSYINGNHDWPGKGTSDFPPVIARYAADKLIYLVNGDNFTNSMADTPTTSLLDYARWVSEHRGAGVGAYRMSRDYNHTPHFYGSRLAIQIMNPAGSATFRK